MMIRIFIYYGIIILGIICTFFLIKKEVFKDKEKRQKVIIVIIILVMLLVPVPTGRFDGGTIDYSAILYSVTEYHQFAGDAGTLEGIEIVVLGITIYENTYYVNDSLESN